MATLNNFKLDVCDAMGYKYAAYKETLTSIALGSPQKYYELKSIVYTELRDRIITGLYDHVYSLLTTGRLVGGGPIGGTAAGSVRLGEGKMIPNFPMQEVSSISVALAKSVNDHITIIMSVLLPDKNDLVSRESISIKGISDALRS